MTGGYSHGPFRSGGNAETDVEAILNTLNAVRGSAYYAEPGSIIWVENMAIARTLADAWAACQRFANQFLPQKMTVFLARWEAIFGITPGASESLTDRRDTVDAKFKAFNLPPLTQNVQDYLTGLMGDIFLNLLHIPSSLATGYCQGGATISGGVTLGDGYWNSSIANVPIRLHQPLYMNDGDFYDLANKFRPHLDAFLPAWTTFNWGRYSLEDGYISLPAGTLTVTGSGTLFLSSLKGPVNGKEIEVYDDNGVIRTLLVTGVSSETSLTVLVPVLTDITSKNWRRFGFFLDQINTDNAFLDK